MAHKRTEKRRAWERENRRKKMLDPVSREKYYEYQKAYRLAHPEKYKAAHRRWYEEHGGREKVKEWAANNREKMREASRAYLARMKSDPMKYSKLRAMQAESAWRNNWKRLK